MGDSQPQLRRHPWQLLQAVDRPAATLLSLCLPRQPSPMPLNAMPARLPRCRRGAQQSVHVHHTPAAGPSRRTGAVTLTPAPPCLEHGCHPGSTRGRCHGCSAGAPAGARAGVRCTYTDG
jgi:hypothetical protein